MTIDERFERTLPTLLEDRYLGPRPDYRDDLLARTAATRQRPAWRFPGRWLPMTDLVTERVAPPRIPWRTLAVALTVIALLAGTIVIIAIGAAPKVPPPFGPAANGLAIYAKDGDIFTADPDSGRVTPVVTGPDIDVEPRWSLDGQRMLFTRRVEGLSRLYVADQHGRNLASVTTDRYIEIDNESFSPDGSEILFGGSRYLAGSGSTGTIVHELVLAPTDGSGERVLPLEIDGQALIAAEPIFLPPDGAEIAFVGAPVSLSPAMTGPTALYTVRLDGSDARMISPLVAGQYVGHPTASPDGSRISFIRWLDAADLTARAHVVDRDGTDDVVLVTSGPWNGVFGWSNDGRRVVMVHGQNGGYEGAWIGIRPVDDPGALVTMQYGGEPNADCCAAFAWAPDDSYVLWTPVAAGAVPGPQQLLDPATGETRPAPWTTTSEPSIQRLAR